MGQAAASCPRITFLLTQQSTISSVAGWISGFFSTVRDIVGILKDAREMARDSKSESKNSPNDHDARKPLTDGQLFGTFVIISLGIIFTTWIGCWLGMLTTVVFKVDWFKCLKPLSSSSGSQPGRCFLVLCRVCAERGRPNAKLDVPACPGQHHNKLDSTKLRQLM